MTTGEQALSANGPKDSAVEDGLSGVVEKSDHDSMSKFQDAKVQAGFFVVEIGDEFAGVVAAKEEGDGAVAVADGIVHDRNLHE